MGKLTVENITDKLEKRLTARKILEGLKEWFEIEEAREDYITKSADWIFLAAKDDGEPIGFLCLEETGKATAEIAVMGVLKDHHRNGMGRALVESAKRVALDAGYSFLQVKTVKMGMYEEYDKTNLFYQKCGFLEFEVIREIWGDENPCQIYVMSLK